MKSTLLVFSFLFVALHAAFVNRNLPPILDTPTDAPPCSMNASSAYVDIILVIDTSANMGTANLRKISTTLSLVLPKFTIGQQIDITQGFRNTRIAVVTYGSQATIAANYIDINSVNDLSNVLTGLSASNSQEANLYE
uniref:VWFA domain-containing protein n=1 Tax=Acrobeloides nanus TaxID=290746 RepID=A0A914CCV5_9BILA